VEAKGQSLARGDFVKAGGQLIHGEAVWTGATCCQDPAHQTWFYLTALMLPERVFLMTTVQVALLGTSAACVHFSSVTDGTSSMLCPFHQLNIDTSILLFRSGEPSLADYSTERGSIPAQGFSQVCILGADPKQA
jgi:hypothetical protein